jgi:hypothetical protein
MAAPPFEPRSANVANPSGRRRRSGLRIALWVIGVLVVVFVVIQFVPYGRDHTNPPVTNQFKWTSQKAEAIARESCYDCHSNETKWWWATNIAPFSWFVQHDVDQGRAKLNFSEWKSGQGGGEMQEAVNGEMPPLQYTLLHPGAKLTDAEKQELLTGFQQSLGSN